MTFLYVLHVFALMTQSYAASSVADDIRSMSLILSYIQNLPPDEL
jgi:hypothetical protein